MSERDKQRQNAKVVSEQITALENLLESTQKDLTELKLVREILNEPPRKVVNCALRQHYALANRTSFSVDCSECGVTVFGYEESWKFCPACGAVVTEVCREDDQTDRFQSKAAKELFNKLQETANV